MKAALQAIGPRWDRWWFSRFDPLPAGVFRIGLGLLMTVMFLALYPNWDRYYAADGILSLHEANLVTSPDDWWSVFHWTEGVVPVQVYWWVGLLAAVMFTIGWHTRLATICLFVLQSSMIHRNLAVVNGEDLVFRMLLFYGCFAPLGARLSVDRWLARRAGKTNAAEPWPPIWPIRLMQLNVACIYLFSVPVKLTDPAGEWLRGDAMYWSMMSNMWSRWPWPAFFYAHGALMSRVTTYGTVLVEAAFPLLVWFRRTNGWVLAAATLLHLGIALVVPNVTFFTLSMVCAFCLFVPADRLRRWFASFRRLEPCPASR